MGYVIAGFVALGLLLYLAASFVGVGDDEPRPAKGSVGARLRSLLDALHGAAPLLLAVIWIAYGLMHLMSPKSAELQMSSWFGSSRYPIWYASGAFEIAIGLLVVDAKWRRVALLAQLLMLVALTPFVVYMLGQDKALTALLEGLSASQGRVVLVLHNLLLFVWTLRLYRDELARLAVEARASRPRAPGGAPSPPPSSAPAAKSPPPLPQLEPVMIVALVMLAANVAGCWVIAVGPWRSGALYLWAMSSLAIGALIGFLFGVPRWVAPKGKAAAEVRTQYQPNTNIEKLSDWLTKMLVGVGLVELHALGPTLNRAAAVLASGLTPRGSAVAPGEAQAFAAGLIAYFLAAGLIQGFLLTRMFIARAWNNEA